MPNLNCDKLVDINFPTSDDSIFALNIKQFKKIVI